MRYKPIPSTLFMRNRQKLISMIPKDAFAVINSNDEMPRNGDQFHPYRQHSDFFYLTGIEQERSILVLIPGKEGKDREVLFVLKPNKKLETWEGKKLTKKEASTISGIEHVKYVNEFDFFMKETALVINRILLNDNEYPKFDTEVPCKDRRFIGDVKIKFPLHTFERLAPLITELRTVKEPEEIELIKQACRITSDAFKRVAHFIKPGVKEYEIEAEITHEFIRQGAGGHAYQPIIASGKNNCKLHYNKNDQTCRSGELVLMDFGAEYANYSADTTRTLPVDGKFTERQLDVYRSVLKVLKEAEGLYLPGTTINQINALINQMVEIELVRLKLAKASDFETEEQANYTRMKYYMHGAAHFMGLDVHDVGGKDMILRPGMVLSCEPGIYIESEGFGIRLENDLLITEGKAINLLADEPVEPEEIEALMR